MDKRIYIIEKLQDTSCHREVAFKAKVSERTLRNAMNPEHVLNSTTLDKIYDHFKRREK